MKYNSIQNKKFYFILACILAMSMLVSACTSPTPEPTPTSELEQISQA